MKIELDDDVVDNIVLSVLKKDYRRLCDEITDLKLKQTLQPHQQEDLKHSTEYKQAIEGVLRYYMYIGDAEKFIKECNDVQS